MASGHVFSRVDLLRGLIRTVRYPNTNSLIGAAQLSIMR